MNADALDRKSRGRPPIHATLVGVRMAPDLISALDRFAAEGGRSLSRPEALRSAFREFALARGYLRPASSDEGTRPEQLTSDNDG